MGKDILLGETLGRDRLQAPEKALIGVVLALDRRQRDFLEPVVVAVVSEGRGAFGVSLKLGLVVFLKERVLSRDPRFHGGRSGAGGRPVGGGEAAGSEYQGEGSIAHV